MDEIDRLRKEIAQREADLAELKSQLAAAEARSQASPNIQPSFWKWPLPAADYERYSRQMIVPKFGLAGQLRLKKARVLLVGAGGLGCPAAAYLAGAGVGKLGLVDGDQVEVSNLHRQIAHSLGRVGKAKVESAITYLRELNPSIRYEAHLTPLTPQNARDIVSRYDVVLDCTDHPTSRYLISDICVLLAKPLVSASAFQTSGQLIVLNNPPGKGPCYRCVFPKPPPPESVVGCGEGGILGPVVGVMGVMQALECIKMVVHGDLECQLQLDDAKAPTMLLFSAMGETPFRSVRMRSRRKDCFACSEEAHLTLEELETSLDYVQLCGVVAPVDLLGPNDRITAQEYDRVKRNDEPHILLDVREREHFDLCHLDGSINIPLSRFMNHQPAEKNWLLEDTDPKKPVYVICRVGNDSQVAVKEMKEKGMGLDSGRPIVDVEGGMQAWKKSVDPTLPFI